MNKTFFLLTIILIASIAKAQLRLDTSYTAEEIVKSHLLQKGSDLIISNVVFRGTNYSIATFENESPEVLMDKGIILSTGSVFDALGPNEAVNTGSRASGMRDADLQAISTGVVIDAVSLEFDLIALRDSLTFTYVFASEEYPEYVDKGVNDVFAFFIHEVGTSVVKPRNIAKIPNSRVTVSIDNVNHRKNEKYFLRSDFLDAHPVEFWEQHKEMMMRARVFEFDGFTVPLKAGIKLKEGKKYHLKIALSDVGDRYYDSAVLLKAHSLTSKGKRIASADSIVKSVVTQQLNKNESFDLLSEDMGFSLRIHFNVDEAEILKESFAVLEELTDLLESFQDLRLNIIGHTDSDGATSKNQLLSENRAKSVRTYLVENGIAMDRLSTSGRGEKEAISTNETEGGKAKNRRVDFKFSY